MKLRILIWFSCGDASAVAAKLALEKYKGYETHILYCDTGGEHEDNKRFLQECEGWYSHKIEILKSEKYADHFDVFEKTKYIAGIAGARCTTELKKVLRFAYQEIDDIQVFGYTVEERNRAKRFNLSFPEVITDFILIEQGLKKEHCHAIVESAGIEIPAMYKLGYDNNNCIGCPKGGAGYWNKIRVDFPEVFLRMCLISRKLKVKLIVYKGQRIYLDELPEGYGNTKSEPKISCDFVCQSVIEAQNV